MRINLRSLTGAPASGTLNSAYRTSRSRSPLFASQAALNGVAMIQSWLQSVEQLMLSAIDNKARVVGIVSPEAHSGAATICRMLATCHASAGSKALLVDLTTDVTAGMPAWTPGPEAAGAVEAHPDGYATLTARASPVTRSLFNKVDSLRLMFDDSLAAYDAIVVDLPPLLDTPRDKINPLAAARACDAVIMVCLTDHLTQQRLEAATTMLSAAGVNLAGVVLDDHLSPPLGAAMARDCLRLSRYVPGVGPWLQRKLLGSDFLNTRL